MLRMLRSILRIKVCHSERVKGTIDYNVRFERNRAQKRKLRHTVELSMQKEVLRDEKVSLLLLSEVTSVSNNGSDSTAAAQPSINAF